MSTERYDGQTTTGYEPVSGYEGRPTSGNENELVAPVPDQSYRPEGEVPRHAAHEASTVSEVSLQGAQDVKDTTLEKAAESKDVLLERGGDVVAVARDEAADLAREAQAHVKDLWAQASAQLQEQASMAQKQVADLLHSLAGEMGEMASKSEQHGPVTSLARQAATKGGALSQWLTNAETGDVLLEVKRLARKRPMVFLAGAAVTGILVGRLGRSLMATDDSAPAASPVAAASPVTSANAPVTDAVYGTADSTRYADASLAGAFAPGQQYESGVR